mgnify:CR=1 FL=1
MEKEELRKKIARIHTAILTHTPVGRDENDFPVAATQTYLYDFISQELDKAREEGKLEYILSLGWQDTNNEYVKEVLEDADRIANELSKLKDNK